MELWLKLDLTNFLIFYNLNKKFKEAIVFKINSLSKSVKIWFFIIQFFLAKFYIK
jgi:hypothetical protein